MLIPQSHLGAAAEPGRRYRLLEQVRRTGRELRYSERTIRAYVQWIRRFVLHFGRRHPRELGSDHVQEFLNSLTLERRVAPETFLRAARSAGLTLIHARDLLPHQYFLVLRRVRAARAT